MERETGFEPATSTLARSHSTTELFPLIPESTKISVPRRPSPIKHRRARTQGSAHGERVDHHFNRRLPSAEHDPDDIEATRDAGQPTSPHVIGRHANHLPLLRTADRLQWAAEGLRRAGLHFDEHQDLSVAGDDVNFAVTSPITTGKNRITPSAKLPARVLLARFSERRLMTSRHAR